METLKRLILWGQGHRLAVILILAVSLRLVVLDRVPPSLNWDEVSMGYTAYSLLETGKDEWGEPFPLLFRSYGEWKSPVYIYLLVPFIKVIGLNAWAVRLPAALAGIAAVYLTYLLGRKLYTDKIGLLAALLLAVSPWHLMLSRPGYEAGVALALVLTGIYNLLHAFEPKASLRYALISSLAFGLAPHTYNSAKVFVPLIVFFLLYHLRPKLSLRPLAVIGFVLFIFALPLLLNLSSGKAQGRYKQVGITTDAELTTDFYEYRKTFPMPAPVNRLIFSKYSYFLVKGFQNWSAYLSPSFLLTEGGPRPQHNIPYRGVLYFAEGLLVVTGLFALRRFSGLARYFPLAIIAFGLIPAAITKDAYHVLRSLLTLPGWQLLAALGVTRLAQAKPAFPPWLKKLYFLEVVVFLFLYFLWYPRAFAKDWQYGYSETVRYAVANQDKYHNIIFTKWYGEPQLFVAFYGKLDPVEYQRFNRELIRYEELSLPWLDQLEEYRIGKFSFRYLDWKGHGDNNNNLYVGKADDFWNDTRYLKQVKFPDGSVAFNLVEGQ